MARPWLKLWRKTQQSFIWLMPPLYLKVWFWILINADDETGEIRTSLDKIAADVAWDEKNGHRKPSRRTISRAISELEKVNSILTEVVYRSYTKITVVNWAEYQSPANGGIQTAPQEAGQNSPTLDLRREVLSTSGEEEGTSQKSPSSLPVEASPEAWKLIGTIEKELSCPLHALGHHARILDRQWRSKFSDAQILEASVGAADWLRSISGHKMDGLFGVLKRYDPNKERPWKNRCPECGHKGFYDRPSWSRPGGKGTQLMTKCVRCNHKGSVSAQIEREIKAKSGKRGVLDQEALLR